MLSNSRHQWLAIFSLSLSFFICIFLGIEIFSWGSLFTLFALFTIMLVASLTLDLIINLLVTEALTELHAEMDLEDVPQTQSPAQEYLSTFIDLLGIKDVIRTKVTAQMKGSLNKFQMQILKKHRQEDAKLKNQERINLARQIRHDIRSPLSYLQAFRESMSADSESREALGRVIQKISLLIEDLNEVDKVDEKISFIVAELNLEEKALDHTRKFKNAKNASLTFEFDEKLLTPLNVREKDFNQVIESLLQNALHAVADDGSGKAILKIENQLSRCVISIEDNGCGISPEKTPLLFIKGGNFGTFTGIGLGLYRSKKIIESLGGKITHTHLNPGAKFEITLPVPYTGITFSGLPKTQKMKVIDDDSFIPKTLSEAGYNITQHAKTFEAGKKLLADSQSDDEIIFIDQQLDTGKYGTELISQQARRKNIYLCTNDYDNMALIDKARAIGVKVVPKPLIYML